MDRFMAIGELNIIVAIAFSATYFLGVIVAWISGSVYLSFKITTNKNLHKFYLCTHNIVYINYHVIETMILY